MKLQDIKDAWNSQADDYNQWDNLGADEMIDFTLKHIEEKSHTALDHLISTVYSPDTVSISVIHAINHLRQIFST